MIKGEKKTGSDCAVVEVRTVGGFTGWESYLQFTEKMWCVGNLKGSAGLIWVRAETSTTLWSPCICRFLKSGSGSTTPLLLLLIIPPFPPLFSSASVTVHFPLALFAPSRPSHRITSSWSYIFPCSISLHLLPHKPQATVNTLSFNRGDLRWGKPHWQRGMPATQLPLIFHCTLHLCSLLRPVI